MTARRKLWVPALAAMIALAMPVAAADSPRVLTVLTVKVKGDQDAYVAQLKKFLTGIKRLDTGGTTRVWRTTLAGSDTRMIFVATEFANLEAMAKGTAKLQGDEELRKLRKDLDASGIREIVSDSLFEEITP